MFLLRYREIDREGVEAQREARKEAKYKEAVPGVDVISDEEEEKLEDRTG